MHFMPVYRELPLCGKSVTEACRSSVPALHSYEGSCASSPTGSAHCEFDLILMSRFSVHFDLFSFIFSEFYVVLILGDANIFINRELG